MPNARLLILTLVVIFQFSASWAQLNKTTAAFRDNDGDSRIDPQADQGSALIRAMPLPDAPGVQRENGRVIDKKFVLAMAALGGAEAFRYTTHQLVLVHEFSAGAPWVLSVPSTKRLVATDAAIFAAEVLVSYELKKPHSWLRGDKFIRKFWMLYPATMIPLDIKNGMRSINTQAPSCPVELCQAP